MFENIGNFFKKMMKTEQKELLVDTTSKDAAKERLHIVLMQDRANVSADFLELMKQEIIDVIKKYIVIDEEQIDVRLTNQENEDGTTGAPSLYANIPILNIRNDIKSEVLSQNAAANKTDSVNNIDFTDKTVMIPVIDEPEKNTENINEKTEEISQDVKQEESIEKENEIKEETEINTESNFEDENAETEKIEENEKNIEEKIEDLDIEEISSEDIEENESDFDDEDDDDVTFDDLLKAAEEEERKEAEEKAKIEKENSEKKKNTSSSATKKKTTKGKKKGTKSTSKKKK